MLTHEKILDFIELMISGYIISDKNDLFDDVLSQMSELFCSGEIEGITENVIKKGIQGIENKPHTKENLRSLIHDDFFIKSLEMSVEIDQNFIKMNIVD